MSDKDFNQSREPIDVETEGKQLVRKTPVANRIKSSEGLKALPKSFEELSNLDPNHLGGAPQSILGTAIVSSLYDTLADTKDELRKLKVSHENVCSENTKLKIENEKLKSKISSLNTDKNKASLINAIGMVIFGIGINLLGNEKFGDYPLVFIILGVVVIAISYLNFSFRKDE